MFAYFFNNVNIFLIKYMNFISCQGRPNAILNENFVILKNASGYSPSRSFFQTDKVRQGGLGGTTGQACSSHSNLNF